MKKWKTVLSHIPRKLRAEFGFKKHMKERPKGIPRGHWAGLWADQHGAKWPLPVRIAAAPLPKMHHSSLHYDPPKLSPRIKHHISKSVLKTAADNSFLQTAEWRRLRMVVITKRGARCECCGASPKDGVTVINVDHIKPRRLFPKLALTESNLQILCSACNHGKGNWDQTDWRPEDKKTEPSLPEDWNRPMWSKPETVN